MKYIELLRNKILELSYESRVAILLFIISTLCITSIFTTYKVSRNWIDNNPITYEIIEIADGVNYGVIQTKHSNTQYSYYSARVRYSSGLIRTIETKDVFEYKSWQVGDVKKLTNIKINDVGEYSDYGYTTPWYFNCVLFFIFFILPISILGTILIFTFAWVSFKLWDLIGGFFELS